MRDIYTLIIRNKDHLLYFFVFFLSLSLLFNNESPNILLIRAKANDRFSKLYSPIVWYKNNINLQNEINFLREKNIQLSLQVDDLVQSGLQNEYLKKLLNFKEESTYNIRTAKVINLGSGPIFSSLTIDLGSNDGIKKNLPIITTNGIVGKTILINEETSLVQTINDANFRLSVKILPSEATGIMRFYDNDVFEIREIQKNANIKIGDKVVTSGFSKIYPEGLNAGVITEIIDNRGSFQKVARSKNPYSDNFNLYVFVVQEQN